MNVAQYIARYLVLKGAQQVFMVTGGGAMFLNDALSFEQGLNTVFMNHEQSCAMAAEGYARVASKAAIVNVTTGPGGINALNGVFGAFTDSIPMIVLSGQVKTITHLKTNPVPGLRQLGDQEVDILEMAKPITKWSGGIYHASEAPSMIAKAWALAHSGRPGPVWLDIPIDVQSAVLDDETIERGLNGEFDPLPEKIEGLIQSDGLRAVACEMLTRLLSSEKPVMLWGTGMRLSQAETVWKSIAESLNCPVLTGWTHDTLASDHELNAGRPGTIGTRAGNIVLQKSDLVWVLGSRLNIRQVSYNTDSFAKNAHIVHVDIDPAELNKPGVKTDEQYCADLKALGLTVLELLNEYQKDIQIHRETMRSWLKWIQVRKEHFPVFQAKQETRINPYEVMHELFQRLPDNAVVVTGNASVCIMPFQVAQLKEGQRLFSNSGSASMGYDLPAGIGAACAAPDRPVFILAGDGSIQMNIQELDTLKRLQGQVSVLVLDNDGYLSIKLSQGNFFKRWAGSGSASGLSRPDFKAIAMAYGLKAFTIEDHDTDWKNKLDDFIQGPCPQVLHLKVNPEQAFEPKLSAKVLEDGRIVSPELEDMAPFIDREELEWAMSDELTPWKCRKNETSLS